jgi:hypothetical protein
MSKITVKHFLNTNLKPYLIGDEKYYKVYFLLRYQNKSTKLRSITDLELTEVEYNNIQSDTENIIFKRLKKEVEFIENIVKDIEIMNKPYEIKVFNDFLHIATYPIIERFQEYIKWQGTFISMPFETIHEQTNIEILGTILIRLKRFVIENPICISDEIYFAQLKESYFVNELEKFLKNDTTIKIWELKQGKDIPELGEIIKNEYEAIEYNTINYLIDKLLIENKFHLDFQKCFTGAVGNTTNYINNIIRYYSVI